MLATAKVFTNGHSQAIRLPKAFRVDVDEMWIARFCPGGRWRSGLRARQSRSWRTQRLENIDH